MSSILVVNYGVLPFAEDARNGANYLAFEAPFSHWLVLSPPPKPPRIGLSILTETRAAIRRCMMPDRTCKWRSLLWQKWTVFKECSIIKHPKTFRPFWIPFRSYLYWNCSSAGGDKEAKPLLVVEHHIEKWPLTASEAATWSLKIAPETDTSSFQAWLENDAKPKATFQRLFSVSFSQVFPLYIICYTSL